MKKLIVSLFMSAALIIGVSAMAQKPAGAAKVSPKAKTEVKADASCKTKDQKCNMKKAGAPQTKVVKK